MPLLPSVKPTPAGKKPGRWTLVFFVKFLVEFLHLDMRNQTWCGTKCWTGWREGARGKMSPPHLGSLVSNLTCLSKMQLSGPQSFPTRTMVLNAAISHKIQNSLHTLTQLFLIFHVRFLYGRLMIWCIMYYGFVNLSVWRLLSSQSHNFLQPSWIPMKLYTVFPWEIFNVCSCFKVIRSKVKVTLRNTLSVN